MHSAHHSRGRIAFEVFCALALAGSLAGAWAQTDASALLSAAAVAALYGVWHLTDLRRPKPAAASAPAAAADEPQGDLLAYEPPTPARPEPTESPVAAVTEAVAKPARKAPKPRKSRAKETPPTIAEITDRLERELGTVAAAPAAPEPAPETPETHVDESPSQAAEYVPATPLFEPEPFVRQQRAAFGRKARP